MCVHVGRGWYHIVWYRDGSWLGCCTACAKAANYGCIASSACLNLFAEVVIVVMFLDRACVLALFFIGHLHFYNGAHNTSQTVTIAHCVCCTIIPCYPCCRAAVEAHCV